MFDTQHSKRPENDRSSAQPTQESSRTTRNTQHTGDLTRIPLYTQTWGNLPPPWLRPDIPPQAPQEGKPLQRTNEPTQRKENTTGLPDTLKAGVEQLSGLSMDDVNVHYNSSEPAEVQALAYTQGTDIHVGSGQEKHLAHEAWHVVQQMRGKVKPTFQAMGVAINDDERLEEEADAMGARANQVVSKSLQRKEVSDSASVAQLATPLQFLRNRIPAGTYNTHIAALAAAGSIRAQHAHPEHNQDSVPALYGQDLVDEAQEDEEAFQAAGNIAAANAIRVAVRAAKNAFGFY